MYVHNYLLLVVDLQGSNQVAEKFCGGNIVYIRALFSSDVHVHFPQLFIFTRDVSFQYTLLTERNFWGTMYIIFKKRKFCQDSVPGNLIHEGCFHLGSYEVIHAGQTLPDLYVRIKEQKLLYSSSLGYWGHSLTHSLKWPIASHIGWQDQIQTNTIISSAFMTQLQFPYTV